MRERQIERLRENRRRRDEPAVQGKLQLLTRKAVTTENLVPYLMEAVVAGASIGETTRALKATFGEYREVMSR